jgi:hypothetical protein
MRCTYVDDLGGEALAALGGRRERVHKVPHLPALPLFVLEQRLVCPRTTARRGTSTMRSPRTREGTEGGKRTAILEIDGKFVFLGQMHHLMLRFGRGRRHGTTNVHRQR